VLGGSAGIRNSKQRLERPANVFFFLQIGSSILPAFLLRVQPDPFSQENMTNASFHVGDNLCHIRAELVWGQQSPSVRAEEWRNIVPPQSPAPSWNCPYEIWAVKSLYCCALRMHAVTILMERFCRASLPERK